MDSADDSEMYAIRDLIASHIACEADCKAMPTGCGCALTSARAIAKRHASLKADLAEWKQAASVEAGLRREFSARLEELEAALREIIQADQIQTFRTIEVDPAGNTMAILVVDGSCATIARAALPQSSTPAVSR